MLKSSLFFWEKKHKLDEQITFRIKNAKFPGIIFIQKQTYREISESALVKLFLKKSFSSSLL